MIIALFLLLSANSSASTDIGALFTCDDFVGDSSVRVELTLNLGDFVVLPSCDGSARKGTLVSCGAYEFESGLPVPGDLLPLVEIAKDATKNVVLGNGNYFIGCK